MKTYSNFIFESYSFDAKERRIELTYSLDGEVTFTERILLNPATNIVNLSGDPTFERALFALHLIGGVSYYKTCLPKTIEVKSGALSPKQAAFWDDVYENGLGEFFFKNDIDFRGLVNFPVNADEPDTTSYKLQTTNSPRALVPIGGGKDSLVTVELLKKGGIDATLFRMGSHPLIETMATKAGFPLLTVERHLDGQLFKLNADGALNGHVPITAYLSILGVIVAMLTEHTAVILSNERSANEGNVTLHGKEINHQWSKSLAFESALQAYLKDFVGTDITYFSLLRPLSELHITKLLSEQRKYWDLFTSCNANWRIVKEKPKEKWCGHCPKCAFAFAMLSPYLSKEQLIGIFQKNLFEDTSLLPLYKELLGIEGIKPFECVGTPEETKTALLMARNKVEFEGTPVMDLVKHMKLSDETVKKLMTPTSDHAIPQEYQSLIP